ncbi:hypothetical protein PN416_17845 [Halorubrum ezzemoulense]|uniref:hypothetical protein n=1 Tax=Halorubrum ezzemoulense TaxID=337243 RepID=UPI00232AC659|nr:hypothetical protein [Halorubrum ezzemoulense]MDB9281718.1 hypothetical protein [Halorubrum ezzemoulense]MDB9285240.1 hypothetical protein [Halorubrum ezzemoulense]
MEKYAILLVFVILRTKFDSTNIRKNRVAKTPGDMGEYKFVLRLLLFLYDLNITGDNNNGMIRYEPSISKRYFSKITSTIAVDTAVAGDK